MAIYIIPIFCFGLVITGIVFLGVRQAADLAKQLASQENQTEPSSKTLEGVSLGQNSIPARPLASVSRP